MDCTVLLIFFFGFGLTSCSAPVLREYHYVNLSMKWADAQHYCRLKYTDLATIESMADTSRLNRPSSDSSWLWIGLTDDPKSWKEIMGNDANSWRWSTTGETGYSVYHNWVPGQPNDYATHQTCVCKDSAGRWHDWDCQTKFHFVCYNDRSPPGRKKYYLRTDALTWNDAQSYCRTRYRDLAMIENAQENAAIMSGSNVWIGLYRILWTWSDNSMNSFRNWQSGHPSDLNSQYCAAENPYHQWSDLSCNEELSFWCHGAIKVKVTLVKLEFQTDIDLSDPASSTQILQKLGAVLANKALLTDFLLRWKTQPRKQGEEKNEANG